MESINKKQVFSYGVLYHIIKNVATRIKPNAEIPEDKVSNIVFNSIQKKAQSLNEK